jgi:hypothetical protein
MGLTVPVWGNGLVYLQGRGFCCTILGLSNKTRITALPLSTAQAGYGLSADEVSINRHDCLLLAFLPRHTPIPDISLQGAMIHISKKNIPTGGAEFVHHHNFRGSKRA